MFATILQAFTFNRSFIITDLLPLIELIEIFARVK